MQNKTDKLIDDIIEKLDKEKIDKICIEKINTWNGELSKQKRINLIKKGAIF